MIRAIDLQNTILAAQNTPAVQPPGQLARIEAAAAQAALAAHIRHQDEVIAATSEVLGNRVGAKEHEEQPHSSRRRRAPNATRTAFEQVVDEAAGESEEPPHIVDYTA